MKAIRLEHSDSVKSEFPHLEHMYSGYLSRYYYKRFDMALEYSEVSSTDSVLDLGGGTGVFTLSLMEYAGNIHLIDIQQETEPFQTAQKLIVNELDTVDDHEFILGSGTDLPVSDSSYDIVYALDVLEHIKEKREAMDEVERVLKSDGRFIVTVPIEIGPALLVRESYRYLDGKRQNSESVTELARGITGRPEIKNETHHRGFDYRDIVEMATERYPHVYVQYCPSPLLRWLNPTAVVICSKEPIDYASKSE